MFTLQEIELEIANLKADLKKTKTQSKKEVLLKQITKLNRNLKAISAYETINVQDVVVNGDPTKLGIVTSKEIQNELPIVWVDWNGLTTSSVPEVLKIIPSEQLKWQWIENNYTRLYDRISCNDMAVLLEELDRLKTEEKVLSSSPAVNLTSRTYQAPGGGADLSSSPADDLEQNKAHQAKIIELWQDAIAFHYPLDEGFFLHNRKVVVKSYQLCKQHNLVFPVVFDGKHQHLAHPLELRRIPLGLLTKVAHGGNHGAYEPARQPRRIAPPQDRTFAQLNIFPEDNTDPNEPEEPKILEDNTDSNESEEEQVVGNEKRSRSASPRARPSNDDYSTDNENTSNLLPTTSPSGGARSLADETSAGVDRGDFNKLQSTVGSKTSNQKSQGAVTRIEFESLKAPPPIPAPRYLLPTTSLTIDPEFKSLIPSLEPEERERLEQTILLEGCRDPLVIWKDHNILIDGHNRYSICTKHNLPFSTVEIELEDRNSVISWIINNQLARRNLKPDVAAYLRGKLYRNLKQQQGGDRNIAGVNQYNLPLGLERVTAHSALTNESSSKGKNYHSTLTNESTQDLTSTSDQSKLKNKNTTVTRQRTSDREHSSTSKQLAKSQGVSEKTIRNNAEYNEAVDAIALRADVPVQYIINSPLKRKEVIRMNKEGWTAEEIQQKLEDPKFNRVKKLPKLKAGDVVRIRSDRNNKDFVGYNGTIAICDRVYENSVDIRIWQELIPSVHKQFLQLVEGETVTLKVTLSKEKLKNLMLAYDSIEEAIN